MDDVLHWLGNSNCFLETKTLSFAPGMQTRKLHLLFPGKETVNLNIVAYEDCSSLEGTPCKKRRFDQRDEVTNTPPQINPADKTAPCDSCTKTNHDVAQSSSDSYARRSLNFSDDVSSNDATHAEGEIADPISCKRRKGTLSDNPSAGSNLWTNSATRDVCGDSASHSFHTEYISCSPVEDVSTPVIDCSSIRVSDLDSSPVSSIASVNVESLKEVEPPTEDDDHWYSDGTTGSEDEYVKSGGYYICKKLPWHGRQELPVHELHNKVPYIMQKVCDLLVSAREEGAALCTDRPLSVRQDAIFLLDLEHMHKEDIVSDGNGTYSKELRHYRWVVKDVEGKWKRVGHGKIEDYKLKEGELFLYWNTYAIPEHGLRRQTNWLLDHQGKVVADVAFLQYTLPRGIDSVHFTPSSHGNARKKSRPFLGKLSHSTRTKLKSRSSTQKTSRDLTSV